jgi:hypothetical protein
LVTGLKKLATKKNTTKTSGKISPHDRDHIERLKHFYPKCGFEVTLYPERQTGEIVWKNNT